MATVEQRYLNSGSSGGDGTTNATSGGTAAYATLNACLADIAADYPSGLVSADVQINVDVTGLCDANGGDAWPGMTQDSTRFLRFRPASGQSHAGVYNSGKAGIKEKPGGAIGLSDIPSYTRFDDMQVVATHASTACTMVYQSNGVPASNIRFTNPIFHGATAFGHYGVYWPNVIAKGIALINPVFSGTWDRCIDINYPATGSVLIFYNGTFTGFSGRAFSITNGDNGVLFLKNNRTEGSGVGYTIDGTQATANNFSSDTSSPDGASYRSKTGTFTNSGGFDFSLQSGDAGIDQGADLSADATYAFSTDILGATRSGTWEIGAFNFAAGGGGGAKHSVVNSGVVTSLVNGGLVL